VDIELSRDGTRITARASGAELDLSQVRHHWDRWFRLGRWPVEDIYYGLCGRFVGRVHLADPEAFQAIRGRSTLYLGNHQTAVESLLFSILASGLSGVNTVTLAKIEHQHTWVGQLIDLCFRYPGAVDPKVIQFFDRSDRRSLPRIIGELGVEMDGPGKSVMIHVEGTRSLSCGSPVRKMSGSFIDMAIGAGAPIVPVRFAGGLPGADLAQRTEYPLDLGKQDIYFGTPILPETLAAVTYRERKSMVLEALNLVGPPIDDEQPNPGDPELRARAERSRSVRGLSAEHAVLREVLCDLAGRHPDLTRLLSLDPGARTGEGWLDELAARLVG